MAMYYVKKKGRNNFQFFADRMNSKFRPNVTSMRDGYGNDARFGYVF